MNCPRCNGPFDLAARLIDADDCTDCARRDLNAQIARDIAEANRLKVRGQAQASAAHPADRQKVERAIRQLAATGRPFSANDARNLHGIKGGVVGATFTALKNEGVIRTCGDETSTDAGTHGHRIFRWIGTQAVAA